MLRTTLVASLPLALAGALLLAAPASSAPVSALAAQAKTFKDDAGDSGGAPDITDVAVGNDVVAGPIVFWITLANRTELPDEEGVAIFLDTDRNPFTGADLGDDYAIVLELGDVALYRWDGSRFMGTNAPSLRADFYRNLKALRISIHPSHLGGVRGFDFFLLSFRGEEYDLAPNGAPGWSYALTSGRPPLRVAGFAVDPRRPVAGKQLAAGLAIARGDTLEPLDRGKVTCALRVGTRSMKATRPGFRRGVAVCAWRVPASAKGAVARGTITVSYGGATVKRSFSVRLR